MDEKRLPYPMVEMTKDDPMAGIPNCTHCANHGNPGQPISPSRGYCLRCKSSPDGLWYWDKVLGEWTPR